MHIRLFSNPNFIFKLFLNPTLKTIPKNLYLLSEMSKKMSKSCNFRCWNQQMFEDLAWNKTGRTVRFFKIRASNCCWVRVVLQRKLGENCSLSVCWCKRSFTEFIGGTCFVIVVSQFQFRVTILLILIHWELLLFAVDA